MPAREEQETTVTFGRIDEYVSIWTNNIVDIRTLEKEDRAVREKPTELTEEWIEAGWGVDYRVKAEDFTPLGGFKRRVKPKTEEQRKALGERLRAGRGQK